MAGDDPETDSSQPRKEVRSLVTISASPLSFPDRSEKKAFWKEYREYIHNIVPEPRSESDDEFEQLIRDHFPKELEKGFRSFLSKARRAGTADPQIETKRRRALDALKFSVGNISYGTIDIETIIEHLDQIIDAFSLTVEIVTAVLTTSAPGALDAALGFDGPPWAIAIPVVSIPRPSIP
jgi:hypothetical protein